MCACTSRLTAQVVIWCPAQAFDATKLIINSFLRFSPVLLIVVLGCVVSGVLVILAERRLGKHFGETLSEMSWEGFWWAFIVLRSPRHCH